MTYKELIRVRNLSYLKNLLLRPESFPESKLLMKIINKERS
jgi:hypothetical protein